MSQSPDSPVAVYTLPRLTWLLLGAALGLVALAFHTGLGKMVEAWLGSEEYSHAVLIPFIAAFLAWRRRDLLERIGFTGSWGGCVLVAAGIGLLLLGRAAALLVLQQYALLIVIYGLALALLGWEAFRRLGMPLLLLLFMVPLPQFLLQNLSAQLQLLSSQIGVALIRLLGISVFLDGNVIDLGSYKLEVAEACSGLRYLFPLMTMGLVMAYLFQAPAWQRALLFLSSIPVTVLMNSFRIGMIGVLVEWWGPGMARGFVHDAEGWMVFMASVGVLLLEMWLLTRLSRRPWRGALGLAAPRRAAQPVQRVLMPVPRPLLLSAALLGTFAVIAGLLPARAYAVPARVGFADFPVQVGSWEGRRQTLQRDVLDVLKLNDYLLADYAPTAGSPPGAAAVNLYLAWYDSQAAGESVHSPRSCIPGGGWRIGEFGQRELAPLQVGGQPLRVNRAVIAYGTQRQLVYYWFQQRGRIITNEYLVKWYLVRDAIQLQRSDGALVRVTVSLRPDQTAADADAEMQRFVAALAPLLPAYIPG
ncbi:MAG: VPLPA-CTERM-specific exosortase XrtD [Nevskia sp.]|nr:VPLPA-CTERM-specific exosortase XrtD [Nevskia sp.]